MTDTPAPLWVERTAAHTYTGHNASGATVRIGPEGEDGVFSPVSSSPSPWPAAPG
ncbi:hypothetical protein [Litorihabitans aurantiacus]|uniref:Uncharacterized protein n=1 Tax=Litorihabitans aurantiacus TaxID=1930061 RepID=A0AA37XF60_9MICO|nr:hypothetical protein [Litorihabitans aurantiacus]GMA32086.1 hypothetical protein GCM10025875_20780 [Litorihabitans aurantiacus]